MGHERKRTLLSVGRKKVTGLTEVSPDKKCRERLPSPEPTEMKVNFQFNVKLNLGINNDVFVPTNRKLTNCRISLNFNPKIIT